MNSSPSQASLWRRLTQVFRSAKTRSPRIAVLIDCDGVSPSDASKVVDHMRPLGRLCILRTYGNLTGRGAAAWTGVVRRHGMIARHMPSVAPGKNATDIALAIDAIEMLLNRRIDTFVLVTSDSDLTPLAHRIREEGKEVIGFGSTSSPESLRRACTAFRDTRTLNEPQPEPMPPGQLWSRLPRDAEQMVVEALASLGWNERPVPVSLLREYLTHRHLGFDTRLYRRRTLTALLRDLPAVELIEQGGRSFVRPASSAD